ncbi:ParB/RepB/Spo0J family partition protein [Enterobacter hormaechei]|nr:ParB N-terminal domain-containing protein [Klebsiella quasipneumoniae]HBT6125853.1 ParB N-terminal domain-containing protein [Klebsiella quasipneumoniae]HBT6220799.1 ParB N-terminal domain-containing protein [Klebsiella quasipneumoniae]HBT6242614.1 ParB N-terminal domain-containing protein [Klebsiella quasipneumoniae]HDN2662807.1 ParB N-terminal domain-containing protein [Enterobacter hormaechei]
MNTMTQTEVHTTHTAAALEVADPAKNLILVPLSQLRPSRRNVRKTHRRLSIPELAASIQRVGLLQNLIVSRASDGEHYDVEAGDRRLAALKLLLKKKHIASDYEVPCLLVADGSARTVSLTENVQREAMHPADQFEAFAALVKEGRPIEDIAADFSVTPLVVQRRLKLANVSPRLITDYRADAVTLDQLMALAITDDHSVQEAAFYDAPDWQRSPSALRNRLTEREIDAQHPLARFVGLDSYIAAGGSTRRDLFAEDDSGTYLADAPLLEKLVRDKLASLADKVRAEGWAWVDAVPHLSYADKQAFQHAPRQRREPNARESRRITSLQARLDKISAELEDACDTEDEDKAEALEQQHEQVAADLQAAHDALQEYAPDVRAVAGAIVTIDRDGEAVIHRGLLREAEAKALRTLEKLRQGFTGTESRSDKDGESVEPSSTANLSDRLVQRLSVHRTAALQIEVARHPQVALAALVHGMVQAVLQDGYYHSHALPLGVRLNVPDRLEDIAPDWPESPAAVALRELQQVAGETLPQDNAALFSALVAKPQDDLVRMLAICVASTVDVITPRATAQQPGMELAQAVGLDMAAWWTPTAEGYFKHVSKDVILAAVGEFAPEHVTRLAKLKKADIASEAEWLADGTGWMPAIFRAENTQQEVAEDPQVKGSEDDTAIAGEQPAADTIAA